MAGQARLMALDTFLERYGREEQCRAALFAARWQDGFVCPRCGATKAYVLRGRPLYECATCGYQASVTAGTALHRSHVRLCKWFQAMYWDAESKRGISATELHQKLGVRYPTAWYMLHRLRSAMGQRDANYVLQGVIEADDAYFGGTNEGKVGRGTEKPKAIVSMSVDTAGNPVHLKVTVVPDFTQYTTNRVLQHVIAEAATVRTDGLSAFGGLKDLKEKGFVHEVVPTINLPAGVQPFPYVHTQISNVKAWINGTFHGLGPKHLQAYLDEFCYRFNRRRLRSGVMARLVVAVGNSRPLTYRTLIGKPARA